MKQLNALRPIVYEDSIALKVFILIITSIIMVLASGIFYAWPNLLLALEDQGVYKEYCYLENETGLLFVHNKSEMDDKVGCIERDLAFNRIYTYAMVVNCIAAIPHGMWVDKLGGRFTMLLSSVCYSVGCYLFSISSYDFDYFTIGACLVVFGGGGFFYACFPLFYTMGKHRDLTLTVLSFAWDSSVVMFLLYNIIYRETGLRFQEYFLLQIIPAGIVLLLVFVYPVPPPVTTEDEENELGDEMDRLIRREDVPAIPAKEEVKPFFSYALSPIFIGFI